MKRLVFLLFILINLLLLGCQKSHIEIGLEGSWSIDEIYWKNKDVLNCLDANIIYFSQKTANVPKNLFCINESLGSSTLSKYKIIKLDSGLIPYEIYFKTQNQLFSGAHHLVFYHDKKMKLLRLEIFSKNLYLLCRKNFTDYSDKKEILDDLSRITLPKAPL